MKFPYKTLQICFFLLFAVNIALDIYLYTLPSKTTFLNYIFNATYGLIYLFGAVVSVLYGIRFGIKSDIGKMLLFFGIGLLAYEIGNTIWVYYNLVLKVSIPFPSFADLAYVSFYPLTGIGCFYLLRLYRSTISKSVYRDSIIIIIVASIAVFGFFSKPDLSAHLSFYEKLINFLYPTGDVILLSMSLIAIRAGAGKIHSSLYTFCLGLVVYSAADFLFVYRTANSTYWNGDISDLLYTCGGYIVSIGLFQIIHHLVNISTQTSTASQQETPVSAPIPTPAIAPIPAPSTVEPHLATAPEKEPTPPPSV